MYYYLSIITWNKFIAHSCANIYSKCNAVFSLFMICGHGLMIVNFAMIYLGGQWAIAMQSMCCRYGKHFSWLLHIYHHQITTRPKRLSLFASAGVINVREMNRNGMKQEVWLLNINTSACLTFRFPTLPYPAHKSNKLWPGEKRLKFRSICTMFQLFSMVIGNRLPGTLPVSDVESLLVWIGKLNCALTPYSIMHLSKSWLYQKQFGVFLKFD